MQSSLGFMLCALCFLCRPALVLTACGTPGAGYCNVNNSRQISDKSVYSVDRLRCSFQESLCFYGQGCRDLNMSEWTAGEGFAQVRQTAPGCGGDSYSVLESLWTNFTAPVCLQFTFSRYKPQALEVFLASGPTETMVQTLLGPGENKHNIGEDQTVRLTIKPSIGKILFRMYGGAHPSGFSSLKLYPVAFEKGRCEPPACNFNDTDDRFCGWKSVNWEIGQQTSNSDLNFIKVIGRDGVATLTSPLTRATGQNDIDCLKFEVKLKNDEDSLDVAIRTSGVSVLIWSLHNMSRHPSNSTGVPWIEARVQIATRYAYKIILRGQSPEQSGGRVWVRDIGVTTDQPCTTLPVQAAVNVTLPLGTTTPGPTGGTGGPEKSGDSEGAVIGGAVAAVIVVIIVAVVVGIFLYRRRLARKSKNSNTAMDSTVFQNGPLEQTDKVDSHDYMEIMDSQLHHPGTVNDHVPSTSHVTGHHDDVNPYEVSEDGSVKKTPVVNGHNYNRLKESQSASSAVHSLHTDEGDYSYISDAKNSPRPQRSSDTEGDYSHIEDSQNFPKPEAGNDDYSHIGDSPKLPNHKVSDIDDSYSHIGDSRNAPKHEVGSVDDSYNRIGNSQNSPRHGVADDYNHIGNSNNSPKREVDSVSDGYSHINSSENSRNRDGDYNHTGSPQYSHPVGSKSPSHGQGSGKPCSPPSYKLARMETEDKTGPQAALSQGYCLVRKNNQTAHAASSPPQAEGDYHIIEPQEYMAAGATDTQANETAMIAMPAESNPHDPSQMHLANQNKFTTVTAFKNGDTGDYALQKPIHEDVLGYNTLSFEESRKQSLDKGKSAVTHKSYDHVQSDPDDNYSKTQTGRRNVVVDSDYDHLNL